MKTIISIILISFAYIFSAQAQPLSLENAESHRFDTENVYVRVFNKKVSLYIHKFSSRKEKGVTYHLSKSVIVPVRFNLTTYGIDSSIVFGAGDTDLRTGDFSHYKGQLVRELFDVYKGKAFNLGLLIGGGSWKAENSTGINFKDSVISSLRNGVDLGFTSIDYVLQMEPLNKIVRIEYILSGPIGEQKKEQIVNIESFLESEI